MAVVQYTFTHKLYTERHQTNNTLKQHNNLGECGPCPVLVSYTLAFALQLRGKSRKTLFETPRSISVFTFFPCVDHNKSSKSKGLPRQAEVAQGVPDRLRPRIFLMFRHYKGDRSTAKRIGRLYPRRNPWYSLSEGESTSGHMVL